MPRITRTELPPGYRYIPHFLSELEERELLCYLQSIAFAEGPMFWVAAKGQVADLELSCSKESWGTSHLVREPRFSVTFRTVKQTGVGTARR